MRTGVKIAGDENKLTKIRKIKKSKRQIDWRESRVGFARPVDKKEERTFVAKMAKYPDIIQQLVGAAKDRGLFEKSQVFAVADGGIGLKEALEDAFPGVQFILDRPHLKEHLYAGVEAMELPTKTKKFIYDSLISLIARGKVSKIIKNLQNYQGVGAKRIANLANYLIRFRDCVHYQKFERLGLPIGSGEVESAHKYIPQKRMRRLGGFLRV